VWGRAWGSGVVQHCGAGRGAVEQWGSLGQSMLMGMPAGTHSWEGRWHVKEQRGSGQVVCACLGVPLGVVLHGGEYGCCLFHSLPPWPVTPWYCSSCPHIHTHTHTHVHMHTCTHIRTHAPHATAVRPQPPARASVQEQHNGPVPAWPAGCVRSPDPAAGGSGAHAFPMGPSQSACSADKPVGGTMAGLISLHDPAHAMGLHKPWECTNPSS